MHGRISFSVEERILYIHGEGPVNNEFFEHYKSHVQPFREQLENKPWASVIRLSGVPLFPPQGRQHILEIICTAKNQNLAATAVVIDSKEYRQSVKQFWHSIYTESVITHQFFDNTEDAVAWLKLQLSIFEQ